jgi:hypothetical protein
VEEQALSSAAGLEEMRQELAALYGVPKASILLSLERGGLAGSQMDTAAPPEKSGWAPGWDTPASVSEPPPLVLSLTVIEPGDAEAATELERRIQVTGDDQISHALHAQATHTAPHLLHIAPGGQPLAAGDGRFLDLHTSADRPSEPAKPENVQDGSGWGWLVPLVIVAMLGAGVAARRGYQLPSARSLPSFSRHLPSIRSIAGLPSLLRGSRLAGYMRFKDSGSWPRAVASSQGRGASVAYKTSAVGTGAGPRDFKAEAERMRAKLREKEAADRKMNGPTLAEKRGAQLGRISTQRPRELGGEYSSTPTTRPPPQPPQVDQQCTPSLARPPPSSWQAQRKDADASRARYAAAYAGAC